jgi:hypothetical protein
MNPKRILLPALFILLSVLACKLPGQASAEDELAETLTAEEALAQATADALRPTYEYNQTQAALPTPTMTPMGPIFDGGDGLETESTYNLKMDSITNDARSTTSSADVAHNYLFEAEAGTLYQISVTESADEPTNPRFTLIDPDGTTLLQVDNTLGTANATAYVIPPVSGIYTLRVQTYQPGPYKITINLPSGTGYSIVPNDDERITSDFRNMAIPTRNTPVTGLIGTTNEAINYIFNNPFENTDVIIRVDASGRSDPALALYDTNGQLIATDDNSGGDLSAELRVTLTDQDKYLIRIWMNSVDMLTPDTTENFSLSVTADR